MCSHVTFQLLVMTGTYHGIFIWLLWQSSNINVALIIILKLVTPCSLIVQGQGVVKPEKIKKAADPVRQAANKVSSMLGGGSSSYNSHMLRSNRQVADCLVLLLMSMRAKCSPNKPCSQAPNTVCIGGCAVSTHHLRQCCKCFRLMCFMLNQNAA